MRHSQPVLLLDLGNTRLKWRLVAASQIQAQGHGPARSLEDLHRDPAVMAELDDQLGGLRSGLGAESTLRVVAGSVGNPAVKAWLTDWLERQHQLTVLWVSSLASFQLKMPEGGIRLEQFYAEPERLGVDRWLAALGFLGLLARRQWPGPLRSGTHHVAGRVALVSAGTATVVDGLALRRHGSDIRGEMSGGLIYPGFGLMRSGLADQTADLAAYVAASRDAGLDSKPPTNSIEAIGAGIAAAQIGALDWLGPVDWVAVHGGHADDWLRAYSARAALGHVIQASDGPVVEEAPDLVLAGLSLLAEFS